MSTLHYSDFFDFTLLQRLVKPSNETNCTPVTSETPSESSSSDTVDSLILQRFNIRNSLLLRLVKGIDSTDNADDRCESGDCPADAFGCLDIAPPRSCVFRSGFHRCGLTGDEGLVLANCTVREMKCSSRID